MVNPFEFQNFSDFKSFGDNWEVVTYYDFPSKLFCLTVPKYSVEEPFIFSGSFRNLKTLRIRKRGWCEFLSIVFCLTAQKHFMEQPICVAKTFRYRKCLQVRERREEG